MPQEYRVILSTTALFNTHLKPMVKVYIGKFGRLGGRIRGFQFFCYIMMNYAYVYRLYNAILFMPQEYNVILPTIVITTGSGHHCCCVRRIHSFNYQLCREREEEYSTVLLGIELYYWSGHKGRFIGVSDECPLPQRRLWTSSRNHAIGYNSVITPPTYRVHTVCTNHEGTNVIT